MTARTFLTIPVLFFFLSCTSVFKNRAPNSIIDRRPIPLDAHQHYVPNSDGFLEAPNECITDLFDIKFWEEMRSQVKDVSKIEAFEEDYPKPILGEIKESCSSDFPTTQEILTQKRLQHTLLISQAFTVEEYKDGVGMHDWAKIQNVEAINNHVSEISLENPDKISGLCGLNYSWSNDRYQKEISACEKMRGLVGYKFYWDSNVDSTSPRAVENLNYFFNAVKGKKRVVLWHLDFPSNKESSFKNVQDYLQFEPVLTRFKALTSWAIQNPDIYFIFAHGFYSPDLIMGLFQFGNSTLSHAHNVYFDLSAADTNLSKIEMEKLISVARRIGIWRFLFGTDGAKIEIAYAMYRNRFGFDESETEKVVFQNGQHFLRNVIFPIKTERLNQ